MKHIEMFTDGACSGNPGPGGWACLLRYGHVEKEYAGGAAQTTNNRMELSAVLAGLQGLKEPCEITLTTDSKYVLDGATKYMATWQQNGWRKADKKPVLNQDLWQELARLSAPHQIHWRWIKGHAGHPENERVDHLACQQRDSYRSL